MTVYAWVLLKVIIGMAVVIGYLNATGRNQIALMTSVDLVGNFILGGVVGGILYNDSLPITHYLALLAISIAVMVACNTITRKVPALRKATIGEPIPLINDGQFMMENLTKHASKIDLKDVATSLRMQNIFSFDGIRYAQLETTGHVSVICDEKSHPSSFLVLKGELQTSTLETLNFHEDWVRRQLALLGFKKLEDVFLAQWIFNHMLVVGPNGHIVSSEHLPLETATLNTNTSNTQMSGMRTFGAV